LYYKFKTMEKTFNTKTYGEVVVRNAMLEDNDHTTLVEGIEIKGYGFDLVELYQYYDIDNLTADKVNDLIISNT